MNSSIFECEEATHITLFYNIKISLQDENGYYHKRKGKVKYKVNTQHKVIKVLVLSRPALHLEKRCYFSELITNPLCQPTVMITFNPGQIFYFISIC